MIKQVLVMRADLKMRKGKCVAQGAHASISFLVKRLTTAWDSLGTGQYEGNFSKNEIEWMFGGAFTKICLQVSSEAELMEIYEQAETSGLEVHMITDAGKTEFNGVPTRTCLAIGPDTEEKINQVTGHLKLY